MKTKIYILLAFVSTLAFSCKQTDEFLTRDPLDKLTDDTYWTSEGNVRTFAFGFYTQNFPGYAAGFDLTWGGYFSGESLNDDFAPTTPTVLTRNVPATANLVADWNFSFIRKANLFIDRIKQVPMSDEAKNNWTGVGRFFRAMEYAKKVRKYGDFPYYNQVLSETDNAALYKPRDSRELVMDSVLADFKYAVANVRAADLTTGPQGLVVNKYVVLAFMSRVFLFEGTWQKYQKNNIVKANEYLEASKWAANEVMSTGLFAISSDYRKLFTSLDLTGNTEVIMYRSYLTGIITHSLNSYNNKEPQTGVSKNAIESYLDSVGLPIGISTLYQGDKTIKNVMAHRDPRLKITIAPQIRLNGVIANYSSSGYATQKFLNEDIKDLTEGNSSLNTTDAPVIRYAEVLLNYAEASAELGTLTQEDLNKTINKIRKRAGVNIPDLGVIGTQATANGVVYDDPSRDSSVSSILWEIRRERRVELMMEGFRNDDLRRWKKYTYLDTKVNADINRGAWIKKADYPTSTLTIENSASEGYIIPAPKTESQRMFDNARVYLTPIPQDQIKLYKDQGVELTQNPGW
ncbi:Putative outer membrane protein [Arcticibacter svalbardensis MN12-7]|uniref:Putative outer membrane protein n=1 Tax=Arcticibacter svalbardensis MN12-7 TaxID=1150600 RepID=R9GM44_9SPHI|nr:RagB/SusD family nutrient uptake outer membrane protein [Arcticibacter svalbardensis]EOR92793.1 Putative outer membrane protein [Arcticibacter svalbardensis MN12-7]